MNPLITVVIPAFNAEKYIGETLETVINQTYKNFEILIIDDGSTDKTKHVVDRYISETLNYETLNYYWQKNSGGASSPRNFGISKARGKYIAFLDADDLWEETHLENSVFFLESQSEIPFCFSNFIQIGESAPYENKNWFDLPQVQKHFNQIPHTVSKVVSKNGLIVFSRPMYKELLLSNFIHTSSVVLEKSLFDNFGTFCTELSSGEDRELWLRFARNNVLFGAVLVPSVKYRVHVGSLSRNSQSIKSKLRLWTILMHMPHNPQEEAIIRSKVQESYLSLIYTTHNIFIKAYYRALFFGFRLRHFSLSI